MPEKKDLATVSIAGRIGLGDEPEDGFTYAPSRLGSRGGEDGEAGDSGRGAKRARGGAAGATRATRQKVQPRKGMPTEGLHMDCSQQVSHGPLFP